MKVKKTVNIDDLRIGDMFQWSEDYSMTITDIEKDLSPDGNQRFDKTTITFDLYEGGLFPRKIGWSFYVFYGHTEVTFPMEEEREEWQELDS